MKKWSSLFREENPAGYPEFLEGVGLPLSLFAPTAANKMRKGGGQGSYLIFV